MKVNKVITNGKILRSYKKFSRLILWKLYADQYREFVCEYRANITKGLSLRSGGLGFSSAITEFKQRFFNRRTSTGSGLFTLLSHDFEQILGQMVPIECFHMTSRRPCWCPKTMKRRPCWCPNQSCES